MKQPRHRQESRQQYLPLVRQEVWECLPAPQREQCHHLLVEFFIHVIRAESRQRSSHER